MLEQLELGLERITMPLPFDLNHVHTFMAPGNNGWTIIDTGLHDKKTAAIWQQAIENKQIERIILTHLHPDHTGYAGTLQEMTGAEVWMSERDSKDLKEIWLPEMLPSLKQDYREAGMPKELADGIVEILQKFPAFVSPLPVTNRFLQDGEMIQLGETAYEVIFTPGHAAGLVTFFDPKKGVLLSTDHVLPDITPNIAYWFYGDQNPLQSFEDSLKRIKRLNAEYVIPSHGEPFLHANPRIDEIWHHHEKRLAQTSEAAKDGVTIMEMCHILFPRKLSIYDYQFAVGETIAHLEYLVGQNVIERDKKAGIWHYVCN